MSGISALIGFVGFLLLLSWILFRTVTGPLETNQNLQREKPPEPQ